MSDKLTSASSDSIVEVDKNISADNIVKNHIIASITLGLIPIPLLDISALTATQMNMLRSLSDHYEIPFNDMDSKSLLMSLIGGSLPVLSVVGLSSFIKIMPGIGSLVGSASLSISAGSMTYAVGQVFIQHFESGGTLEDFSPKHAQDFFKQEFEAGKLIVKELRNEIKSKK
jgi:uncharacterized protein (DUF697 family)